MTQFPDPQYKHQIKAKVTVTYGPACTRYTVQDDGKGYLHIVVRENGKRRKIGIDKLPLFEPGTIGDYIFNGWFEHYTEKEFFDYASAEVGWNN